MGYFFANKIQYKNNQGQTSKTNTVKPAKAFDAIIFIKRGIVNPGFFKKVKFIKMQDKGDEESY